MERARKLSLMYQSEKHSVNFPTLVHLIGDDSHKVEGKKRVRLLKRNEVLRRGFA